MAGMLSHLRLHRRDRSNPTSPVPDSGHWDYTPQPHGQLDEGQSPAELRTHPDDVLPFTSSSAAMSPAQSSPVQTQFQTTAPRLPPITRVTSTGSDLAAALDPAAIEEASSHSARSPYNEESPFIGGLALENYRREQKSVSSTTLDNPNTSIGSAPPGRQSTRPLTTTNSFVSPTDLQRNPAPTGRRQAGSGLASGSSGPTVRADAPDVPKTKKGLPFLKNPMSTLLMRRKTSQNDLSSQHRNATHDQPVNDPRIRGTRVHDFSEPRTRKPVPISHAPSSYVAGKQSWSDATPSAEQKLPQSPQPPAPPPKDNIPSPIHRTPTDSSQETLANSDMPVRSGTFKFAQHQAAPETIRKQQSVISTGRRDSGRPSRDATQASIAEVISSVPKHMKSVSSRFSFDMIASAEEEKILEERHRQRQQDKPPEDDFGGGNRDSRFDDFDDASFDYDALDYDDGLEERIPGVNDDMDSEDELDDYNNFNMDTPGDPDNDQENFAGFPFSRSNGSSSMPDPLRIGESSTVNIPVAEQSLDSQTTPHVPPDQPDSVLIETPVDSDLSVGLGIQALDPMPDPKDVAAHDLPPQQVQTQSERPTTERILDKDDELYFNQHEFDGEGDGSHFDESLFDLDDTDQYGRPIPGLFARALSKRNAEQEAQKETQKRESNMTSRFSAQTALSENTAHTSVSMHPGAGAVGVSDNHSLPLEAKRESECSMEPPGEQHQMVDYQAALAAAAYKAVASGKFERDDSPSPPPADLMVTSPTTSKSSETQVEDTPDENYFDDSTSAGLDDYDLDDYDIIAEANAEALANDSEGWYGQEFGFYSAQTAQNQTSSAKESDNPAHSQYGGVFAPSGLDRSTSGRVLREPNLTPITERSEYSNRNSMMSLHLPPGANHNAPLQSPGLAQLAMMADDDNMSLQSLMRLRSRAWGGSQASLASSREASPSGNHESMSPGGTELSNFLGAIPNRGRKNSTYSSWSQDSAGPASGSGSPTLTLSVGPVPNSAIPPLGTSSSGQPGNITNSGPSPSITGAPFGPSQPSPACPPVFEDEEGDENYGASKPSGSTRAVSIAATNSTLSNKTNNEDGSSMVPRVGQASQKRPGMGHKHRSSADSISYRKETEEDSGETRWVLERRRTGDSGTMEIEQEVLPGRI